MEKSKKLILIMLAGTLSDLVVVTAGCGYFLGGYEFIPCLGLALMGGGSGLYCYSLYAEAISG